ncbi:acylphosphatase [Heyndrickxia acidiproducens]|uniref:acylphosphatase n=1 Tax=Heyndrickxia acidiproducens TaxID=1121084 RepID=UPI000380B390|nr:acylphosphatase [Heyndrickxia acidiproducens]
MGTTELAHIIVTGRVQGVGFRYYTLNLARQHDISGWVKNKDDGSVEVMAEGKKKHLDEFIEGLKKGPSRFAKVEGIEIEYLPVQEDFKEFNVRY